MKTWIDRDLFILETATIKDALKKLDRTAEKVLVVVDKEDGLLGALTDGDIRRCILQNRSLDAAIAGVYNNSPIFLHREDCTPEMVRDIFVKYRIALVPLVNRYKQVVEFATWDGLVASESAKDVPVAEIDVPVIIMAGGKGTRLDPYTRIFPKPLIPLGEKTIVETIIHEFRRYGINKYYLTLNHKGQMIESYFGSIEKDYTVEFVWEKEFLGTAGGIKLVHDADHQTFIVSNCDILVKANYHDVLNFHRREEAALTILSSIQHHKIPYGVVEFKEGGVVTGIIEKPEYTFHINTGVYVLDKSCLGLIPSGSYYDMPTLISDLIAGGRKVVMYPVNENDYIDIGQWEEFKKATEKLAFFAKI